MPVARGVDQIRVESAGVELAYLGARGAVPGVQITQVSGRNGEGFGRLLTGTDGLGNMKIGWQAPGETSPSWTTVTATGDYLIQSGDDPDKWVRIHVYFAELQSAGLSARVKLGDVFENKIAHDDVTQAQASAGQVLTWTVTLNNDGNGPCLDVRAWLDPAVAGMEISDDGAAWVNPTTEDTALLMGDIVAGASDTLHLRRTISPGAASDDKVLNQVEMAFTPF